MTTRDDVNAAVDADEAAQYQAGQTEAYPRGYTDGATAQETLDQGAYNALNTKYQAALAEIAVLEGNTPTPPPATDSPFDGPGFGVYFGGNSYPNTHDGWDTEPNVASFYLGENSVWNASTGKFTLSAAVKAAAADPHILFLQAVINPPTDTFTSITGGAEDAMWKAAIAALDALGKPYLLGAFNEADTAAHDPGNQTGAQFVAMANYLAKNFVSKSKLGSMLVWLAGFEAAATLETCIAGLDQTVIHDLGLDPYDTGSHPASETATQTFAPDMAAIKAAGWTGRVHITETGIVMDKGKTEAQLEAWVRSLPQAFKDYPTLASIVTFLDNSGGKDYLPVTAGLWTAYGDACASIVG